MKGRPSSQVLILMRLLDLCNTRPDALGFTLDDIFTWPQFKVRGTPRDSAAIALERFIKLHIVFSPGTDLAGKRLYKVKDTVLARAYIEKDPKRQWLPLTPTPPTEGFLEADEHRDHFDVQLSMEWFDRIRDRCEVVNNQYTLRLKEFSLSVNGKSLAGQLFVKVYWRTKVKAVIGSDFYDYIVEKEVRGGMKGDFALPIEVIGQRFYLGGRPTQFSASHYAAQLDVRRSKDDKNIVDGLYAVTNQIDFNTKMLDFQDEVKEFMMTTRSFMDTTREHERMFLEAMTKLGDVQTRTVETLVRVENKLDKVLGTTPAPDDKPYSPPKEPDKWDPTFQ